MSLELFEYAVKEYERGFDRLGLKHAGFKTYKNKRGDLEARKDSRGFVRPMSSKQAKKANKEKDARSKSKKKLSGKMIDGRAYRVR